MLIVSNIGTCIHNEMIRIEHSMWLALKRVVDSIMRAVVSNASVIGMDELGQS